MLLVGLDGELKNFWDTLMVARRPPGRDVAFHGGRPAGTSPNDDPYRLSPPIEREDGDMAEFNPDDFGAMDIEVSILTSSRHLQSGRADCFAMFDQPEIGRKARAGTHDVKNRVPTLSARLSY